MKQYNRQGFAKTSLLLSVMALFSFTVPSGGDMIKIFLNKKLVLEQFVHNDPAAKTISLGHDDASKQLEVYYMHCGVAGTSRSITIRNSQNKVLKTWHFTDATGKNTSMTIRVAELFGGIKKADDRVKLYYTSNELPKGKLLAEVAVGQNTVVKL